MRIYSSYMNRAWLLGRDGTTIDVLNHPTGDFEFESILYVLTEYGDGHAKELVAAYNAEPNDITKEAVVDYYDDHWCKVRTWGTFSDEITFRITSNGFNWYSIIIGFLLEHPIYSKSLVTVERYTKGKPRKVFWDKIDYHEATDSKNETILASMLHITSP